MTTLAMPATGGVFVAERVDGFRWALEVGQVTMWYGDVAVFPFDRGPQVPLVIHFVALWNDFAWIGATNTETYEYRVYNPTIMPSAAPIHPISPAAAGCDGQLSQQSSCAAGLPAGTPLGMNWVQVRARRHDWTSNWSPPHQFIVP